MMRNTPTLSALQKSYDDGYQACSTAVYYEGQGNEEEAMRCWRSALSQINHVQGGGSNSNPQSQFRPESETEQALVDSLKQLELQCKERIDLLHALKMSREDSSPISHGPQNDTFQGDSNPPPYGSVGEGDTAGGWIGHGTVPAISYTELSRPALPPRPSMGSRASSVQAVVGADIPSPDALHAARLPSFASPVPSIKQSRSPSPNKRTMRSTLRPSKSPGASSREKLRRPSSRTVETPGAGKAAALAWSGIRDKFSPRPAVQSPVPIFASEPRSPVDRRESSNSVASPQREWDAHTRRLVARREAIDAAAASERSSLDSMRRSVEIATPTPSALSINAAASAINSSSMTADRGHHLRTRSGSGTEPGKRPIIQTRTSGVSLKEDGSALDGKTNAANTPVRRKPVSSQQPQRQRFQTRNSAPRNDTGSRVPGRSTSSPEDDIRNDTAPSARRARTKQRAPPIPADDSSQRSSSSTSPNEDTVINGDPSDPVVAWEQKKKNLLKHLPPGVDAHAAGQILNEIVVRGDDVRWTDVAGLAAAKAALREAVVYPFLRPDLFMGLREPARGLLLFGPPGTGKTMLARAVATESRSTFFSISASSLTSKYLGESEKLVRALFELARILSPAIIFVDEIDSLLSPRSGGGGEHEASRRLKTEFLVQWSGLQRAAAGRGSGEGDGGDPNRVLVLAATNLPWAIDEAARRRFVRRQYIPLPDAETREAQIRTLLGEQVHGLGDGDIIELVALTDGFSGSDITALAKDAAMGPLRSLGEALLHTTTDQIRAINADDFKASLRTIRPSVSPEGLKEYEDWAKQYGERGG